MKVYIEEKKFDGVTLRKEILTVATVSVTPVTLTVAIQPLMLPGSTSGVNCNR